MKRKNRRKKSITTKNTMKKNNSGNINGKIIITSDDIFNNKYDIDELLKDDNYSTDDKQQILSGIAKVYLINNKEIPEEIIDTKINLYYNKLIFLYKTNKERFFELINDSINQSIDFSEVTLDSIKEYISKEDAEKIEDMIAAKKYNL